MISIESSGSTDRTTKALMKMLSGDIYKGLDTFGKRGVAALSAATPLESGETRNAWNYEIVRTRGNVSIIWTNNKVIDGVPVVILLQYGHGTGTGGYVKGQDFINPALRPIFDEIADSVWKAVTSA